jgi:hypothetical protein
VFSVLKFIGAHTACRQPYKNIHGFEQTLYLTFISKSRAPAPVNVMLHGQKGKCCPVQVQAHRHLKSESNSGHQQLHWDTKGRQ